MLKDRTNTTAHLDIRLKGGGGCIVWANYSETLPPPPGLRLFPRMSLTDLVSLTFKDESRTGHTQEHTRANTHGPMETRDQGVVARSSWGEKSLYYDKMHKGPLRAETLLTGPGLGHRICILCAFLFSHQTKIITGGCEKNHLLLTASCSVISCQRTSNVRGAWT